jgi:hypothetical protein
MKGIQLTREDPIQHFHKNRLPHAYTFQSYQEHSYTSQGFTSKVISSKPAHHGDQCIYEKHISKAYDTNAVYDTKMHA